MTKEPFEEMYSDLVRRTKLRLLRMHYESKVGHIGGNLSCLDILMALHHRVMQPEDTFLLSKGHAAGALYSTLWSKGILSDLDLKSFHSEGSHLSGHPAPNWISEIPFATGSLGHGLSLAAGMAHGRKLRGIPGKVYCVLSDGEMQEGSTWEAIHYANHQKLNHLTLLVDKNGLQGFGSTQEVAGLDRITEKLRSFGLAVIEIDGHNADDIIAACKSIICGPVAIVANTRKGCGVSFMENQMEWHYLPMSEAQYHQACDEVGRS